MKAIGKYIVVDMIDEQVKTESGILLTASDDTLKRYKRGVVICAGTDVSAIQEGDTIYFDKTSSFSMMIEDRKHTIIREADVVIVAAPC
jgi:co-chaperonin GroES (HSP10)